MPDSPLLPIGIVRKPHGIKGEVSVTYHADSPVLLSGGVFLQRGEDPPVFHKVIAHRFHHGTLLLRLEGVCDRTAAEGLRGRVLLVPESRLPEPDADAVYLHQLVGLTVVARAEDGTESVWGVISAVADPAGQELWTISREGEADILFPAVPEFVAGFDLEENRVRITPPPGLFALYRS